MFNLFLIVWPSNVYVHKSKYQSKIEEEEEKYEDRLTRLMHIRAVKTMNIWRIVSAFFLYIYIGDINLLGREKAYLSSYSKRLIDSYSHHYHRRLRRSLLNTLITESLQLDRHSICIKQNQFDYSMMQQPKILISMQIIVEVYLFESLFSSFSSLFKHDLWHLSIDTIVNIQQSCCCFVKENRKPRVLFSHRSFDRKKMYRLKKLIESEKNVIVLKMNSVPTCVEIKREDYEIKLLVPWIRTDVLYSNWLFWWNLHTIACVSFSFNKE